MCDATVDFSVLCNMFDAVERAKKGQQKRKHVRKFLDLYTDHEYFSALRLMLPALDKVRNNYGLQETVLGKHLVAASGLGTDTKDAQKLLNWRKGGTRAGRNAGNFALIAQEILLTRQRVTSTGLKIKDVNDMLDRLADANTKGEKVPVLTEMYNKTNTHELRWIIMIILKDLKLGISERTIFAEFHPDAVELHNKKGDFKFVCEELRNRNERYKNLSIEVGKSIAPQRASRVTNVEEAWKKLRGKEVIVECKFDGERIQIHKDGSRLYFYSRKNIDHQKYEPSLGDVLIQNVLPEKCILDGEMLSWDSAANRFLEFGKNREVAKAAGGGLETNQLNFYVAFDLLYNDSGSLIHLPLRQRQELLCKAIRPVKNRLEILNPTPDLKKTQHSGSDRNWSYTGKSVEEIKHFFKRLVEEREEGIVLKDLDSKWEPGDKTGKWLKLKPDYINPGSDLDVLIIGGYFGSGRHGGQIAQFLLGIAEKPNGGGEPTKFISFCKVGTGLSDEESAHLIQKLNPYFRRNEKNSRPPSCYKVTNHSKERPDVWVLPPEKSVILEVNADVRKITTEVFASQIGLRFPRVSRVRLDKPWYDCLDEQTLQEMVRNSGQQGTVDWEEDVRIGNKPKESRKAKKARTNILPLVPSHMRNTDVSNVKPTSKIFTGRMFYFINTPVEHSKESLHKLVVENGGQFSMNLNTSVTHAIASERRGLKFQSAAAHGDVIHSSWILDCCTAKTLLPVSPKYFLHLSNQTKEKRKDEIDDFGDHYFANIDVTDLAQIFKNIDTAVVTTDYEKLAHYKKYCSSLTFSRFSDCNFYFHKPIHSSNPDSQMVVDAALKRQELEVSMHGGTVSEKLNASVTHMIVYTSSEKTLPFRNVVKSIASQDRWMLMSDTLKILSHRWIDDYTIGKNGHGEEVDYDLRDPSFEFNESVKGAGNNENGSPTKARSGVKRAAE